MKQRSNVLHFFIERLVLFAAAGILWFMSPMEIVCERILHKAGDLPRLYKNLTRSRLQHFSLLPILDHGIVEFSRNLEDIYEETRKKVQNVNVNEYLSQALANI